MFHVGITLSLNQISTANDLWCNGLNQNAIFLGLLFKKMGFHVSMIHNTPEKLKTCTGFPDFDIIEPDKIMNHHLNILFILGHPYSEEIIRHWKIKYSSSKVVCYICGSSYINTVEDIIFKEDKNVNLPRCDYDQIWVVPQNEKTSISFLKYYYRTDKITVVPFVWDPSLGEVFLKSINATDYQEGRQIKTLSIMEPNLSVLKNFVFPITVCEGYLRKGGNFDCLYVMCSNRFAQNQTLINFLRGTNILDKKKLFVESRYPTLHILSKWADAVVSFQWGNPMNYLYFDVAWWGWPIIHNAHMCKDVGYYYSEFNGDQAIDQLDYVIQNHHLDNSYKSRMRSVIKKYTRENPKLLKDYTTLINNLMENYFRQWTFNPDTNSIY